MSATSKGGRPRGERTAEDAGGNGMFFDRYYATHLAHRKGAMDGAWLAERAAYFDRTWASLVPADRSARILDAGCGVGAVVAWLQGRGYTNAEGVDISAALIEHGTALGVSNLRSGDVGEHLGTSIAIYDCIIFRDILEHFPHAQIVALLQAACRALAPGGTVIVQVPNAEAPVAGRIRYGDFTHTMAFTEGSLVQLLGVTGFTVSRFAPAGPIARPWRGLPRYALWKAIELVYKVVIYGVSGRRNAIVTESIIVVAARDDARQKGRQP